MEEEPDGMCQDGDARMGPVGRQPAGGSLEGGSVEGGGQVSLRCMGCDHFLQAPLLRHLDACVDALESAAASIAIDGRRPATAEDNRRLRTLNRQFADLRNMMDQLAISVVELSRCCRHGATKRPEDDGRPTTATPAPPPAARPALALVSVNPHPNSRAGLLAPGCPGRGPAPPAPRLRCV